jgi:site-specific DNA-cytosine methylase
MIYLLAAVGQPPGGSSTVHIYTHNTHSDTKQTTHRTTQNKQHTERHKTNNTLNNTKQTTHRTTQNKQHTEQHKTNNTQNNTKQTTHRTTPKSGTVRAVPRLCGFYTGTCLTIEEKWDKPTVRGDAIKGTLSSLNY